MKIFEPLKHTNTSPKGTQYSQSHSQVRNQDKWRCLFGSGDPFLPEVVYMSKLSLYVACYAKNGTAISTPHPMLNSPPLIVVPTGNCCFPLPIFELGSHREVSWNPCTLIHSAHIPEF
uniref:Uncharacterized protein n=1 Tax=Arundo donax TaxID=35708 RepID=A0A0A9NAA2_ARUDO